MRGKDRVQLVGSCLPVFHVAAVRLQDKERKIMGPLLDKSVLV